jgi:hypothetical protein
MAGKGVRGACLWRAASERGRSRDGGVTPIALAEQSRDRTQSANDPGDGARHMEPAAAHQLSGGITIGGVRRHAGRFPGDQRL